MDASTAAKVDAEIQSLIATSHKLNAETAKLLRETRWHPVAVLAACLGATAAVMGATAAAVKLFL